MCACYKICWTDRPLSSLPWLSQWITIKTLRVLSNSSKLVTNCTCLCHTITTHSPVSLQTRDQRCVRTAHCRSVAQTAHGWSLQGRWQYIARIQVQGAYSDTCQTSWHADHVHRYTCQCIAIDRWRPRARCSMPRWSHCSHSTHVLTVRTMRRATHSAWLVFDTCHSPRRSLIDISLQFCSSGNTPTGLFEFDLNSPGTLSVKM